MAAPMTTFKAGDRVRATHMNRYFPDRVGVVISCEGDFVEVQFPQIPGAVLYRADELERVEEEP